MSLEISGLLMWPVWVEQAKGLEGSSTEYGCSQFVQDVHVLWGFHAIERKQALSSTKDLEVGVDWRAYCLVSPLNCEWVGS